MLVRALIVLAAVLSLEAPAFGQLGALIYRQQPNRNFGFVSDTLFRDDFGQVQGSLYADRFQVPAAASLGQLVWYGHYGTPDQGFDPEPPLIESFRIRIWSQVSSPFPIQQLPNEVLYETTSDDVHRELTGLLVFPGRREYRYLLDLPFTFSIQPGAPYWLEVAQIGDVNSVFRWESSTGGERAFQFPVGSAWQLSGGGQLAYELRVPEPGSIALMGLAVALVSRARGRGRGLNTLEGMWRI